MPKIIEISRVVLKYQGWACASHPSSEQPLKSLQHSGMINWYEEILFQIPVIKIEVDCLQQRQQPINIDSESLYT